MADKISFLVANQPAVAANLTGVAALEVTDKNTATVGTTFAQARTALLGGGTGYATTDPLTLGGKTTKYNNIATAGWGTPAIYGSGRVTAQSAAAAAFAAYTVGAADGSFLVSANVNVTTSTLHSFTVTVTYTDETNTSRTLVLTFSQIAGVLVSTITNTTGAGPYEGLPLHIRCKASTAITFATVGTFTTVAYNAEGVITQIA